MKKVSTLVLAVLALLATIACGKATTPTPVQSYPTDVPPTQVSTPVPPTQTPLPTPTNASLPSLAPEPSIVPEGYYDCVCQQPEGTTLRDWLSNLAWYGEIDLSGGGWDCSQIAAYIEWLAENCGHNAVFTGRTSTDNYCGHVWLTIEGQPYEATGLYWIDLDTAAPGYYEADHHFQDIYAVCEYTSGNPNLTPTGEWGWWLTYPVLYK